MATATKKKTQITPLDDRVLIQPDVAEERTASGIYLPVSAKEKPLTGKVIAAGPGKLNDDGQRTALAVKTGDVVLFGKYAGSDVEVDGQELKIMRESELLGVIEK